MATKAVKAVRELEDKLIAIKSCESPDALKIVSAISKRLDTGEDAVLFASAKILERFFRNAFVQLEEAAEAKKKQKKKRSDAEEEDKRIFYVPNATGDLRGLYVEYINRMLAHLASAEAVVQAQLLQILMDFVKAESELKFSATSKVNKTGFILDQVLLKVVLNTLITSNNHEALLDDYMENFIAVYEDVAYATAVALRDLINQRQKKRDTDKEANNTFAQSVYSLLLMMANRETTKTLFAEERKEKEVDDDDDEEETTSKKQKRGEAEIDPCRAAESDAWIAFLRFPMPMDLYKRVLLRMDSDIIPRLSNPLLIVDFLNSSYDFGGVISLLALNSVFVLMTQHNLSYPNFYTKLYSLFNPLIFQAKYRNRFFSLARIFLSSSYLSAGVVAAFIKKIARLSLQAPPAGALVCISFIYHLLKTHTQVRILIDNQKEVVEKVEDAKPILLIGVTAGTLNQTKKLTEVPGYDKYLPDESDPANANALQSSLWEIKALASHYHPTVSRFTRIFEQNMELKQFPMEDTFDESYQSLFDSEIARGEKRREEVVPLSTNPKASFFSGDESFKDLWKF
eukprot:TRINITY_DN6275_c0_g1_i2.p1 TRINITY_DN6275_c0_g1~~TRINITY_DN6275_c0_g1_i2.p1  ORF type:complete len:570 (+),score=171.61 TRINITY_DN6275_c0_g1_i2:151-1860(+)